MDLHTAPEPCQQAVTDVLDRLDDQIRHMAQDTNGCVSVASVRRVLHLVRSTR